MARLHDIVFDATHAASLARFWAAALDGYAIAPSLTLMTTPGPPPGGRGPRAATDPGRVVLTPLWGGAGGSS